MILGSFIISINVLRSQTMDKKLDQVELMKQFIGTWKCDFDEETVFICNNKPFGNGLVCASQIVKNGDILDSITQLFGYDNKADKFIIAELKESSSVIEICSAWFSSKNKGEIVVTNPENAPFKFIFEFRTPDMIVQNAIQDGKVVNEITLIRE